MTMPLGYAGQRDTVAAACHEYALEMGYVVEERRIQKDSGSKASGEEPYMRHTIASALKVKGSTAESVAAEHKKGEKFKATIEEGKER